MIKDDRLKFFSRIVICLAESNGKVQNKFFYAKFNEKLNYFISDFILFFCSEGNEISTQHQVAIQKCSASIDAILDIFKELEYLNIFKNTSLLRLEAELLSLKLDILKSARIQDGVKKNKQSNKEIFVQANKPQLAVKLNESKKKILDYIKSFPNTRTKDIVYEFSSMSGRTVKRNLTDLLREGFVKKRVDNKAVYYYASE